jgi:hypothetical protein
MNALLTFLGLKPSASYPSAKRLALATLDRDQRAIRNQYVAFADRTN